MASFFKLLKTAISPNDWPAVVALRAPLGLGVDALPTLLNPYNRAPISNETIRSFFTKMAYSRMLRHPVCIEFKEDALTPAQMMDGQIRAGSSFQRQCRFALGAAAPCPSFRGDLYGSGYIPI
jgi:hypothetical protein